MQVKATGLETQVGLLLHAIQTEGLSLLQRAAHAAGGSNHLEEEVMHASMAFVNGAGGRLDSLELLNTLLASPTKPDEPKSKDQKQAEEEDRAEPVSKPGGFANDPDDPKNPNEVRERHQRKVRP